MADLVGSAGKATYATTATVTRTTTAHNTLVALVLHQSQSVTITDSAGNTWTKAADATDATGTAEQMVGVYYCLNPLATTSVTATCPATTAIEMDVAELTGTHTFRVSAKKVISGNAATGTPANAPVAAVAGDFVVGCMGYYTASSAHIDTVASGWTVLPPQTISSTAFSAAWATVASTATTGPSWTFTAATAPGEATAAFTPPSSAVAATGSAALALTASGSGQSPVTASASLTLAASGPAAARATGSAALALTAAGTAQTPSTGTASLTLAGAGAGVAPSAGAASLSLSAAGSASATGAPATASFTGGADAGAIFANPGRGFFQYTETHQRSDGTGYVPLAAADLAAARTTSQSVSNGGTTTGSFAGRSVVFRYFYMEAYKNGATIPQAYLDKITTDLAAIRAAGCRARLRFAYDDTYQGTGPWTSDPTPAQVRAHIDQIAPILNNYANVIDSVDAGFIGTYGEWFYTSNFTTGTDPNVLSTQNVVDRNSVITELLNKLDPSIFVNLRYLGSRQAYLASASPVANAQYRLGHHNDAFTADDGNYGTYSTFSTQTIAQNRAYLAAFSALPVGGESATYNNPMSNWADAASAYGGASVELSTYHYSTLNPGYYPSVLTGWGQGNLDIASKNLGYRLRLASGSFDTNVSPNGTVNVSLDIANDGWSAPFRYRPLQVVFVNGSTVTVPQTITTDIRAFAPGTTTTVAATVTAPPSAGTWAVHLLLPDPATFLQSGTISTGEAHAGVYSIRLSNTTYDAVTGRNATGQSLTVSGATNTTGAAALALTASGSGQTPAAASAALALAGSGATGASSTAAASLTLTASGSGTAPATGTAALALTAAATTAVPASASAALALTASGAGRAPVAAAASLALTASGPTAAPAAGSASLAVAGSGAAGAPNSGAAALALTGSGVAGATAAGTASLALAGSGSTGPTASGSSPLALSASGTTATNSTGAGALALSGTATPSAPVAAAGTLTLSGAGSSTARSTASAALALTGAAAAGAATTAAGALALSASGSAFAVGVLSGTASLALTGSGAAVGKAAANAALALTASGSTSNPVAGTGSLTVTLSASAQAAVSPTTALALVGSGAVTGNANANAALSLTAAGVTFTPGAGAASLTLTGTGTSTAPATSSATLTLGATGQTSPLAAAAAIIALTGAGGASVNALTTALLTLTAAAIAQAQAAAQAQLNLGAAGTATPINAGTAVRNPVLTLTMPDTLLTIATADSTLTLTTAESGLTLT